MMLTTVMELTMKKITLRRKNEIMKGKKLYIILIFLLTIMCSSYLTIMCSSYPFPGNKTLIVDEKNIKQIIVNKHYKGKLIKSVVIEDNSKILEIIKDINNNKNYLTKFLPTIEMTIVYYDNKEDMAIFFRGRYFKAFPGGTHRMKKSINKILNDLCIFE